jgi:hypothetical protein
MDEKMGNQPGNLDADTGAATEGGPLPPNIVRGSPAWVETWKCCGCGILMPDLHRICDCATCCVGRGGNGFREHAVKIEAPEPDIVDAIFEALQDSIDMDWTCSVGARAVAAMLAEHGITSLVRRP